MNPKPGKSPVAYVHPSKYVDYKLEPDLQNGERCMSMLKDAGFNVRENKDFEWIHDTFLILIRMFPKKCPPTVIISMNDRFDPHFHMQVGEALRPLRKENYLMIGTGGAVSTGKPPQYSMLTVRYRSTISIVTSGGRCSR